MYVIKISIKERAYISYKTFLGSILLRTSRLSNHTGLSSVSCCPPLQTDTEKIFVPGPTGSKWQSQESAPTSDSANQKGTHQAPVQGQHWLSLCSKAAAGQGWGHTHFFFSTSQLTISRSILSVLCLTLSRLMPSPEHFVLLTNVVLKSTLPPLVATPPFCVYSSLEPRLNL